MEATHSHSSFWSIIGVSPQTALLLCADLLTLLLAAFLAYGLRSLFTPISSELYKQIFSLLLLGPVFYFAFGTYQTISQPPHLEVKNIVLATSLTFLIILAMLFAIKSGDSYSRLILVGAWLISIFAIPLVRGFLRRRFAHASWWGRPLVICGTGPLVEEICKNLQKMPARGLRPVEKLVLEANDPMQSQKLAACAQRYHRPMILLSPPENGEPIAVSLITDAGRHFNAVLLIPLYNPSDACLWLTPRDLGTVVGLLVRQNLMDVRRLRVKRLCDIVISLLASVVTVPVGLFIALCVRCDSRGPVLYTQQRIGQGGQTIRVYKFRTMVRDADAVLENYLHNNPELWEEWKKDRKLKQDPRLTRVGKFLRKTSLDELPQLWNVLMGSMSLVGPRPIVEDEIAKYGPVFEEYAMVKPGITGLWQISGRNNTTYEERVRFDHYYVSNWSVWMDLWILARTGPVVLMGYGAY